MKKTLRFLSVAAGILLAGISGQKANAQITGIIANYYDSSMLACNTPAPVYGNGSYYITGSIQTLDSIIFYINYGDGSDTTFTQVAQTQGWFPVDHIYNTTGNFQIQITLTYNQNSAVWDTVTGTTYMVTNTCSALQGTAWLSSNGDCVYDNGEGYMTGHTIKATNTTTNAEYYSWVDQNGHYYLEVPDNYTYKIEMAYVPNGISPICPNTSGFVMQAVTGTGTFTNDFAYDCNTSASTDFSVFGSANFFRPGHTRHMNVYAETDNFCTAYPATVTLTLDNLLTYVGTSWGTAPTVSGQTLTWNVTSLSQFNALYSSMDIYTSTAAVLGDTLCNRVIITYTGVTDPNHANDTFDICRAVSNSYDPNDKTVFNGREAQGWISNGEELFYQINFQNTGNDTAYDITVIDTLSNNVDVNTFQFESATHPVSVTLLPGNVISFRFEDIYLPDSNVNEPLSHGSIFYKVKAKTGLNHGTQINNTAYIYFDFNPAIITNTTLNTIEIPISVKEVNGALAARIYPNPANNELTVAVDAKDLSVQLYDIVGRPVASSAGNNGKVNINTSALAAGMYILHINADGVEMTTKVNVQH
jgi:uncharacterized repeat protein (TIGR01451 family)